MRSCGPTVCMSWHLPPSIHSSITISVWVSTQRPARSAVREQHAERLCSPPPPSLWKLINTDSDRVVMFWRPVMCFWLETGIMDETGAGASVWKPVCVIDVERQDLVAHLWEHNNGGPGIKLDLVSPEDDDSAAQPVKTSCLTHSGSSFAGKLPGNFWKVSTSAWEFWEFSIFSFPSSLSFVCNLNVMT